MQKVWEAIAKKNNKSYYEAYQAKACYQILVDLVIDISEYICTNRKILLSLQLQLCITFINDGLL